MRRIMQDYIKERTMYELIDTVDNDAVDFDQDRVMLQGEADAMNADEGRRRFVVKPEGYSDRNFRG